MRFTKKKKGHTDLIRMANANNSVRIKDIYLFFNFLPKETKASKIFKALSSTNNF